MNGSFDETAHDLERIVLKAIALKAGRDEGIIVRPDRSQMISKWIIAKSSAGQSAHSPAVEHFIREQPFGDPTSALRQSDSRPQRVPGVGGEDRVARGHRVELREDGGELIARGATPDQAAADIGQVVEGLTTAPVLRELARRNGVELPITEAVCQVLDGTSLSQLVSGLMGRRPTDE